MRTRLILCLSALFMSATAAIAELDVNTVMSPSQLWPDTIVLNWQTLNIDSDQKRIAADALKQSQASLAQLILGNNTSAALDTFAPKTSINDSSLLRALATSRAGSRSDTPILVQPAWSSLHGNQIFMLIISDSRSNLVLKTVHQVVSKISWNTALQTKGITNLFASLVTKMWEEASAQGFKPTNPNLALGLNNSAVSERSNELERNALNLIFAAQYFSAYTIVNPLATEALATIHRAWNASGLLKRSNRNLSFAWLYPESTARQTLPLRLTLIIKPTDGVFAQSLPWQTNESVTLSITANNQLDISAPTQLTKQLAIEEKALNRSENPVASKIRGAWVYLDKGRAWGLKMNDRLILADGSNQIKGHIVAYYGPEMKITSPRGYPVHEGAIMFVRKGQAEAKIGKEFKYDPMEVPTAWPPKSPSNK